MIALLLLALAMPGQTKPEPTLRLVGIYGGSVALDFAATEFALSRGAREGNPLMVNRGVRVAFGVGSTALLVWSTQELQRTGHPKAARCIKVTAIVVRGLAAAHAIKVGLSRKEHDR